MLNAIIVNGVAVVEVVGVEVDGGVSQLAKIKGIDAMPHVIVVTQQLAAFKLVVIGSVHFDRAVDVNGIVHHRPESRAVAHANDVVGIEGVVGLEHTGKTGIPRVFRQGVLLEPVVFHLVFLNDVGVLQGLHVAVIDGG